MKLKEYFETHPINKADFARMAGIAIRTLFNAIDETTDITLSVAMAIQNMTEGKVKCQDMFSKKFKKVSRKK